jgi:hypothetical protein
LNPAAASEIALRLAWEAGRLVFHRSVEPDVFTVEGHYAYSLRDLGDGGWAATADGVPLVARVAKETALFACLVAEGLSRRSWRLWTDPALLGPFIDERISILMIGGYLYRRQGDGKVELARLGRGGRQVLGRYDAIGGAVLAATLAMVPADILTEPEATLEGEAGPVADPPMPSGTLAESLEKASAATRRVADAAQSARDAVSSLHQAGRDLDRIADALRSHGRQPD